MAKIYLDMDGVIADFFGTLAKEKNVTHWKQIKNIEELIISKAHTNFFYTLDKFETSDYLVKTVYDIAIENGYELGICSSPLGIEYFADSHNSSYWKRQWLQSYGYMNYINPKNLVFTNNKFKHAKNDIDGTRNILIDDKISHVELFRKHGGKAIRFQTNRDDIDEYLLPELLKTIDKINRCLDDESC